MDGAFSKDLKDIMAQSRVIALSLGYDYISTIHFFLADCSTNSEYSVRKFVFGTQGDFQTFWISQKVGEPIMTAEHLLLTKEAEKTIRKAYRLWNRSNYFDEQIKPYHLFLSAALIDNSAFSSMFENDNQLYEKLERYYIEIGQIDKAKIYKPFWMRFQRTIRKFPWGR